MADDLKEITKRVREAWPGSNLQPISDDVLTQANIEPWDAKFLSAVGLPRDEILQISFNLAPEFPVLLDFVRETRASVPASISEYQYLNEKYGIVICFDTRHTDEVWCVDLEDNFRNSS